MKKIVLAVAALSLGTAGITTSAVAAERQSAPVSEASGIGSDGPTITAILAVVALLAAVIIVADGSDDAPVSP